MLITSMTSPPDVGQDTDELTTERAEGATTHKKNLPPVVLPGASFNQLPAKTSSMPDFSRMA